jgi:site-specific DNA-adenine methylase
VVGFEVIGDNYARKQWVYPQRRDTASFDPTNLGSGIAYMTVEKLLSWRDTLQRANVQQRDAFEVLESLDGNQLAYIDPPYFGQRDKTWRMYAHEFFGNEHERLRDILYNATFPWMFSINDHPLTWEWYIKPRKFRIVPIRYRTAPRRSRIPKYYEWLICNF